MKFCGENKKTQYKSFLVNFTPKLLLKKKVSWSRNEVCTLGRFLGEYRKTISAEDTY